ncbi:MAG: CHAT domain-containing tetratricopeptide repeat protein [Syntrophobacteraceae bacterium]
MSAPVFGKVKQGLYRRLFWTVLSCIVFFQAPHGTALGDCGALMKAADDQFAKAEDLYAAGKYREALDLLDRAFSTDIYCRPAKAHLELIGLAVTHEALGDYAMALETHRRDLALAIEIFGADNPDTAVSHNNLGRMYQSMGQYPEALVNLEKALSIFIRSSGPDQPDTAVAYNNAASVYEAAGDYKKALEYYENSLSIRLKVFGPDHPATATAFNNLGGIYKAMGQHDKALENLNKALPVYIKFHGPEHPATANAYNNIASVHKALGRFPEALEHYEKALATDLKTNGPDHPSTAVSHNNIAAAYESMEEFEKARENFEKALAVQLKAFGPDHPSTAKTYNNLGSVYQSTGDYSRAIETYRKALPTALRAGDAQLKWNVLAGMSSTFSKLGNPNVAVLFGKQAVNAIQAMRSSMAGMDKSLRKSFIQDKENVYKRLAALLTDLGRVPEAQRVMDLLKEEEFFEFVRGIDIPQTTEGVDYTEAEKAWVEKFAEIGDRIAQRGAEYAEIRRKARSSELSEDDRKKEKEIISDLEIASRTFDAFVDKISAEFEKAAGEKAAELTEKGLRDLKSLQSTLRSLGNGTVAVYYLVTDKKLVIILTTSETQLAREVEVSSIEINHMISDLRKDLLCPLKDPRPASGKLFAKVLAPISRDLEQAGARTLMLSLDGALRYVPFSCLHDGDKYLIERYTPVIFTPASRDKLRVPPSLSWQIAGFGVADKVSDRFRALPWVRYELDGIVKQEGKGGTLPGVIRLDGEFTADAMRDALLRDYPVVHIASHFVFNPTAEESFLLLGDGSQLTLDKIKHQGFRFDEVDLLTLSACETGLSAQGATGREIEGFGVLAQRSGAKGVIASLWSVADRSTGLLMKKMYEARAKNPATNKAECLRRAQLELLRGEGEQPPSSGSSPAEGGGESSDCARRNSPSFEINPSAPYAHPYFWAPFVLMGNFL